MTDDEKLVIIKYWSDEFYTNCHNHAQVRMRTSRGQYWYGFLRFSSKNLWGDGPKVVGPATAETLIIHEAYKLTSENMWKEVCDVEEEKRGRP